MTGQYGDGLFSIDIYGGAVGSISAPLTGHGTLTASGFVTHFASAHLTGRGTLGVVAAADFPIGFPVFVDEVAFASDPFDTPQVYTDLTVRTRQRSWSRGRQTENDAPETGHSSTTFLNDDRALDPENTAGPYYPNVIPMRRIRCRASLDGSTFFTVYTTFIDPETGWQLDPVRVPGYAEATVQGNDGLDVLNTFQLTDLDSFPEQTPGTRINALLDIAAWPAAERDIDFSTEQSTIQAADAGTLAGTSVLNAIQAAAATQGGIFFIDAAGKAVFYTTYRQIKATRANTSQATFADFPNAAPGRFLYTSLTPKSTPIVNDWHVTRNGGVEQIAQDAASILKNSVRSKSLSTLHRTDEQAFNFGAYSLLKTKQPFRRYDEMTLTPLNDPDLWLEILTRQIGDRITVFETLPGGGDPDTRDMHVEAISVTVGPTVTASATYRLSPAAAVFGWLLGSSTLGVDTILVP